MTLIKLPYKRTVNVIQITLCSFFVIIHLNVSAITYRELPEIEHTCEIAPHQCLLLLDKAFSSEKIESRTWYRLKRLHLDALFNLQRLEVLSNELTPLLNDDNLPINLSIYVNIYYAKISYSKNKTDVAKLHLNKALKLLTQIHDKYPDPLRLIEISNLQTAMKEYDLAKETLLQLEIKFKNRYHPIFKRELYANLGHIALLQHNYKLHITYRVNSLKWAIEAKNEQQIGIAYYNLAASYQRVNNYQDAEINYKKSLFFSKESLDNVNESISALRVVEIALLKGDKEKAKILFTQLPVLTFGSSKHKTLYEQLQLKLAD